MLKKKSLGWGIQGEINLFQPDLVGWLAMSDYPGNSAHSRGFCSLLLEGESSGPSNTLMLSASHSHISLCCSLSSELLLLYRTTGQALTGAGGDGGGGSRLQDQPAPLTGDQMKAFGATSVSQKLKLGLWSKKHTQPPTICPKKKVQILLDL